MAASPTDLTIDLLGLTIGPRVSILAVTPQARQVAELLASREIRVLTEVSEALAELETEGEAAESQRILIDPVCLSDIVMRVPESLDPILARRLHPFVAYATRPDGRHVAIGFGHLLHLIRRHRWAGSLSLSRRSLCLMIEITAAPGWFEAPHPVALKRLGPLASYIAPISLEFLSAGALVMGWRCYELNKSRMTRDGTAPFPQPYWRGENLAGKTILLWRDEGPADEVMYASVFPDVIAVAAKVVIEIDSRLVPLFQRSFPTADVVPRQSPVHPRTLAPDIDLQAGYGTPCRYFRASIADFSGRRAFLRPDPARVAHWRAVMRAMRPGCVHVGLAWQTRGSLESAMQLGDWRGLAGLEDINIVNCQYGDIDVELAAFESTTGHAICTLPGLDLFHDLDDLTAAIAALDALVSIDTAVAHLAGGCGQRVLWVNVEWLHNFLGQNFVPWYPSAQALFWRDGQSGSDIAERAIAAVADMIRQRASS
jgi:hypothetical protein